MAAISQFDDTRRGAFFRVDVPWDHGSIHDPRRTYGTQLSRVVPIHVLKESMGHSKIQTTQEYYLAAETEDDDKARKALDAMLSGARNGVKRREGS